jgi:hypothetical protein
MPLSEKAIEDALSLIVDATDRCGDDSESLQAERRAEARRSACTKCELWVFDGDEKVKRIGDAVTRNGSFRGLCVVVKLPGPLRYGLPVEAKVGDSHTTPTYVAGTTAFCTHLEGDYFELGVEVKAVGSNWILANDVEAARARYDWFAAAPQSGE